MILNRLSQFKDTKGKCCALGSLLRQLSAVKVSIQNILPIPGLQLPFSALKGFLEFFYLLLGGGKHLLELRLIIGTSRPQLSYLLELSW